MDKNKENRKTKSKKEDGAFASKNIKHNPQAESSRAVFGKETEKTD
ncbi:hypothetical protein LY28_01784 [Ruminiclostridium sufflavum DSM 19573]|uniref:Uncharacterized protein n=1 Tax=Ruminiclostridium sufflavum DSM 19573 TaxID=1121337 RepID=A0A318XMA0_9FIRM|nr:CPC_1213 family protein [Ruminiclostridium sufflavum]PYG87764.1 hypothetical protein LY28_01784 [Ruminiclostridium sufflavum DSM 19573]